MGQEHDEIDEEGSGPRVARRGDVRQRKRPDAEADREHGHDSLQAARGWDELGREAVEEVREQHEQLDLESLRGVFDKPVRARRNQPSDGHDHAERQEGERQPADRTVAQLQPPLEGKADQSDDEDAREDRERRDDCVQDRPPGVEAARNRTL